MHDLPSCGLHSDRGVCWLQYFPDVSTAGAMHLMPGESMENWDQRAKYVEGAFRMLVAAGWSTKQPGINQMTPCHLLDMSRRLSAELVNSRYR